ncbi:MAG: hypothetical protein J6A77_00615 [Lachnospiraceae bacterium]|nr:hypothetical protein [Lachnospiraceae bacterium]
MKEKIERLSKGIFEYEMPGLIVSEPELDIMVEAGIHKEGTIRITNEMGQRMKGVLYVTGKILVLGRMDFIGTECEIPYRVDASVLQPGEEYTGTISVISDCGECQIPFTVRVAEPAFSCSIGIVRDLFQFASLAQINWKEAVELFASADFSKIVLAKEPKYRLAYEQLSASTDAAHALEEFLVLVHKKKPCDFRVSAERLELEAGTENFVESLVIKKEQWGYLHITVSTEAEYLSLMKTEVSAEDFVNGQFRLEFLVETEKLRRGRYYTELVVSSGRKQQRVPVLLHCHGGEENVPLFRKNMHRLEHRLTELYLKFRNNSISSGSFLAESGRLLETILTLLDKQEGESADPAIRGELEEKSCRYELYQAYLSIVDGRNRGNEEIYERILSRKSYFERNHKLHYCAVLYLESMKSRNRAMVEEYTPVIRMYYEQDRKTDILLWFLLYMDRNLEQNKTLRYETIRQHCSGHMASPALLYEAAVLWNADPLLVTVLTGFECQLINYLLNYNMINKETALQFAYLAEKRKVQEELQIRLLKKLYDRFQHRDILYVLCKKLIQGTYRREKEHRYFRQAVKEQLRLEQLFDYYLYTIDRDSGQGIEQQVLLYYTLSSFPSDEDAAFVYSHVVRNKDSNPAIYRAYLKKMEQFAVNQMKSGKISRFHAVLYADVLRPAIIDREMSQILPELIFTYQVECHCTLMQGVCVAHKEEKDVQLVPFTEKNGVRRALVSAYTENAELFLVDNQGRRYLMSGEEKLYRLMHAENFLDTCYEIGSDNRKLLLHIWEKNKNYNRQDSLFIELQKQVSQMEGLREEVKNSCVVSLVEYYYDHYDVELLEAYLNAVNLRLLPAGDREKMLEMMILRDMYDKVIESVELFGCAANMQVKRLSRLCVRGIYSPREERDRPTLLTMGMFAFRQGRAEERLLQYLADRYNGTTSEMYELWKAAKEQELETTSLEERLLAQMLFAESYVEDSFSVFVSYCNSGMNRKLIRAYFSYCAYKYFVKDRLTNTELFEMLKRESFLESSQICILALLKYYAGKEELLGAEREFAVYYIQKFVQKKLIFAFYKDFENRLTLPASMQDKYYVEYRTNPKSRLVLHYTYRLEEDELQEAEMEEAGYGIFVKELILFYGETLQYFITEETENSVEIVESRMVQQTDTEFGSGGTKYGKINEILMTQDLQDEKTLFALLEQYYKEEYAVKRHFAPV